MKHFKVTKILVALSFGTIAFHAQAQIVAESTIQVVKPSIKLECRIDSPVDGNSAPRFITIESGDSTSVDCKKWDTCQNNDLDITMSYDKASDVIELEVTDKQKDVGFYSAYPAISKSKTLSMTYATLESKQAVLQISCDVIDIK